MEAWGAIDMNKKLLLGLLLIPLLLGTAFAADIAVQDVGKGDKIDYSPVEPILTWHSYNENTKTASIGNYLGLSKVTEVKLISNTESCLTDCSAILEITPSKDFDIATTLSFLDKKGNEKAIDFKTYILQQTDYDAKVPYQYDCTQEIYNNKTKENEKIDTTCVDYKIETQQKDIWVETNLEDIKFTDGEPVQIKIEGHKPINENIDWIPTIYGQQISEMAWWNAGWGYKQPLNISTSTGTVSTGYVYGFNVTYNANMKAGFDDLRFVNGSENAELPYFIGNQSNSSWAYVYVLLDSPITTTNQTIYMYYGNTGASTTSNGTTTFTTFFDHFDNGTTLDLTTWTEINVAGAAVSGSVMNLTGTGVFGAALASDSNWAAPNTLTFNARWDTAKPWAGWYTGQGNGESIEATKPNAIGENNNLVTYFAADGANYDILEPITATLLGGWHIQDIMRNQTNTFYSQDNVYQWNATKDIAGNRNIRFWTNGNVPLLVDWVGIRPYSAVWRNISSTFGAEATASAIMTVTPDAPINGIVFNDTTTIDFNFTAVSSTDLSFLCDLYINGTLEGTEPATANNTLTNFHVVGLSYGSHDWKVNCTDTVTSKNSTTRTFSIVDATNPTSALVSPSGVVASNTTTLNFTCNSSDNIYLKNVTLYNNINGTWGANGTETITGIANSTTFNRTVNFTLANPITWNCEVCDNSSNCAFAPANYSVSAFVLNITTGACPAGWTAAQNYTFVDEGSLAALSGANVAMNFHHGPATNNSVDIYNNSLSGVSGFSVCVLTALAPYYIGYGEIDYSITGYASRHYYLFVNSTLTNTTQAITLYALQSNPYQSTSQSNSYYNTTTNITTTNTSQLQTTGDYATAFQFTFTDSALNAYTGDYARLLRWYPASGQYSSVDAGISDGNGQTVMYVAQNSVDYRVALYYPNGTLLKLADPSRFTCSGTPCTYTLRISSVGNYLSDFGVQHSLAFNNTTKMFTFTWNDPSATTQRMNLSVNRIDGDADYNVCNSSMAAVTEVLSCNISTYTTGTFSAVAYRSASPESPIDALMETLTSTIFKGQMGLFVSFLLMIVLVFVGIYSPIAAVLLSVLSLIPALAFGAITPAIFIGIGALAAMIIHVFKRVS
jgi:hypothetical protein